MFFCDGAALRSAFVAAAKRMESEAAAINALNVFPVPDGDTGTNMALTLQATVDSVPAGSDAGAGEMAQQLARGALMGARGNSGVILSQILRGLARGLQGLDTFNTKEWAGALVEASAAAYRGVSRPVEGTILTVARDSAEAAVAGARNGRLDLVQVMELIVEAARESVARTPSLLATLRDAGVVDSGGQGLCVLFEAILGAWRGDFPQPSLRQAIQGPDFQALEGNYGYCTEFLLEAPDLDLDALRNRMAEIGDSLLVVGDESLARVHLHASDPGAALSVATGLGSIRGIKIDNMQDQHERFKATQRDRTAEISPAVTSPPGQTQVSPAPSEQVAGVVVVAPGAGFADVFRSLGAQAIITGGQTMNPSCEQILAAADATPAASVLVLPNNRNILLTAHQAQELSRKPLHVVPSRTLPQGVAALLAYNPDAGVVENVSEMTRALAQVGTIELTTAVRDAQIDGQPVQQGEFIAVGEDGLLAHGRDQTSTLIEAIRSYGGARPDLITLYYGEGVSAQDAEQVALAVRSRLSQSEVQVVPGGQAHYPYIVSLE